jgi:hypothetical protein
LENNQQGKSLNFGKPDQFSGVQKSLSPLHIVRETHPQAGKSQFMPCPGILDEIKGHIVLILPFLHQSKVRAC